MPDLDDLLDALKDDVADLAEDHFDDLRDRAVNDSQSFVEETNEDIQRWAQKMANGQLSQAEFRSLLQGRKDLAEMEGLKQAGLAAAKVDKFRDALIDEVVETVTATLL